MKNYSRKELSELLKVSLCAIYKWEKKGLIKSFKNERGLLRYSEDEASRFVKRKLTKEITQLESFELEILENALGFAEEEFLRLKNALNLLKNEKQKIINKSLDL